MAAASGPPPFVEPHQLIFELGRDRRAVAVVPIDMTDAELLTMASFMLREGRASLGVARVKAMLGVVPAKHPPLNPRG